jgi:hypothetical protein
MMRNRSTVSLLCGWHSLGPPPPPPPLPVLGQPAFPLISLKSPSDAPPLPSSPPSSLPPLPGSQPFVQVLHVMEQTRACA